MHQAQLRLMQAAARHKMADKASSRLKSNRANGTACLILGP